MSTTARKRTVWIISLENFDKTEDAKALAKTIAGHKDATQEFQEQLSNTDDRIAVVQQSLAELGNSVAKATEMRRKQHAEFATHSQQCRRDRVAHARRKQTPQILRAPSCTRRRRRLSSVQPTACTSTWVARSPPLHARASQARMSHGCSCCRPLPRPSLSPPSSRKITRGTAASCHSSGLWWRIWPRSRRRPRWKRTIPSKSTRRPLAESAASRAQKGQGDRRIEGREGSCVREFGSIEGGGRVCGDQRKRDGQGDQCPGPPPHRAGGQPGQDRGHSALHFFSVLRAGHLSGVHLEQHCLLQAAWGCYRRSCMVRTSSGSSGSQGSCSHRCHRQVP